MQTTPLDHAPRGNRLRHAALLVVLVACVWVGWRDVDLIVPQAEVREGIRAVVRGLIQWLVQYLIPLCILGYFVNAVIVRRKSVGTR